MSKHSNTIKERPRTYSGESPARAALALVLDGGDGTLGAPVNLFGHSDVSRRDVGGSNVVLQAQISAVSVHFGGEFVMELQQ